jgi:hypothetical protein
MKRYISILSAVLFLTASTGLHIIKHYCDTCAMEEVTMVPTHGQNHNSEDNCTGQCSEKHHHQSHEQCDIQFFKVDEPFVINENSYHDDVVIASLTLDHVFKRNCNEFDNLNLYHFSSSFTEPPLIYLNCQLLI